MRVCGPMLSIWVRIAVVPCAIGRAQAEVHAQRDIGRGPVGGPVRRDGVERAGEVAGRVRRAPPDVRLVEMGVRVDERRQDDPAVEVDARGFADLHRARRHDLGDAAAFDPEIDAGEAVAVDALGAKGRCAGEHARAEQSEAVYDGEGRAVTTRGPGRYRASGAA